MEKIEFFTVIFKYLYSSTLVTFFIYSVGENSPWVLRQMPHRYAPNINSFQMATYFCLGADLKSR